MSKQIIVCMDGTWNDPSKQTNVFRLFELLEGERIEVAEQGPIRSHRRCQHPQQVAFYLEGVGANGRQHNLLGGALGSGLHDRVIDAYLLLSQVYQTGDKLWIFGFSRGAWSARSLAGLVAKAGILPAAHDKDAAERAEQVWLAYKSRDIHYDFWAERDAQPVKLVGVWDTVGALGIPFANGLQFVDDLERKWLDFADLQLSPRVAQGRHALAIDETRFDFVPTRWDERQGIKQIWFAGVHADVGGGYQQRGLADLSLRWMLDEIVQLGGLFLRNDYQQIQGLPQANRHEQASDLVWQLRPRQARQIQDDDELHTSVLERLSLRLDYRPLALKAVRACKAFFENWQQADEVYDHYDNVSHAAELMMGASMVVQVQAQNLWNSANLRVVAGQVYEIQAQGKWSDREYETDANGIESQSVIQGWFAPARRFKSGDWGTLIAAVHENADLEQKNPNTNNAVFQFFEENINQIEAVDQQSEMQRIGTQSQITIGRNGYLYLFFNDVRFAYGNNRGLLTVKISRIS